LNWSQSLEIAGLAEPIVISKEDSWRDDDWSNTYDASNDTLGDLPVGAAYETGCGRVIALGDNTFSNADLSWTDNDIYMRNILRWVAAGENCPGNSVP
ncbi:MAG: hypothetical protein GWN61_21420, partial [candidate division Zixibacteria bacterium]|nr:hypothetical protein [candidate division Zixibacteria bacterium]NIS48422.1 hypothetical protein [candidate division Zixibacteria bacterium]NIU16541.1 hypothetical protein [candidate division Zixibacteria bacterium]NIV08666.1 hypothetical protein [candidate division Zixibacteria bacterium]NIW45752.1 hypothetical protein [Gammaproteobacteria bacterium]